MRALPPEARSRLSTRVVAKWRKRDADSRPGAHSTWRLWLMRRLPALEKQWAHEKLSDVGRTVRFGAIAGALVPYLFLLGTIGISWLEEDFMERLGWEVWPSGLALGPDGWLQIVNFIAFGVLLIAFALAVAAVPARNRWVKAAPILLGLAGVAAVMLSFKTDPPDVEETWHGIAHGVAYLTWLASIVIAYPFTWWRVRGHASWTMAPAWPSLLALLLFPPVLLLPDSESAGNYVFFAVVMTPLTAIATRMAVGAMRAPPARGNEETAISVVVPPEHDARPQEQPPGPDGLDAAMDSSRMEGAPCWIARFCSCSRLKARTRFVSE